MQIFKGFIYYLHVFFYFEIFFKKNFNFLIFLILVF